MRIIKEDSLFVKSEKPICLGLMIGKNGIFQSHEDRRVSPPLHHQTERNPLLVKVPTKVSIVTLMGKIKGKTAIQALQKFPSLRTKKY